MLDSYEISAGIVEGKVEIGFGIGNTRALYV